jgi:hypothetical protein
MTPQWKRVDYEARFYVALRQILAYMTPEQMRRCAEKEYGLDHYDALEMAYENMQEEARAALKGYRKPKPVPVAASQDRTHL